MQMEMNYKKKVVEYFCIKEWDRRCGNISPTTGYKKIESLGCDKNFSNQLYFY